LQTEATFLGEDFEFSHIRPLFLMGLMLNRKGVGSIDFDSLIEGGGSAIKERRAVEQRELA
jgi:hypothetical protein